MLKTYDGYRYISNIAYHLGEGRVLKTWNYYCTNWVLAYHLGEGRVLKTSAWTVYTS